MRRTLWLAQGMLVTLIFAARPTPVHGQDGSDAEYVLLAASGIGIVALGVYDIATAPSSARRYNARLLSINPWIDVREERYGVAVSLHLRHAGYARTPYVGSGRLPSVSAESDAKSPKAAFLWSLSATLLPTGVGAAILASEVGGGTGEAIGWAAIASGWVVGPSAGHWYANQHLRGWLTTAIRVGLLALGAVMVSAIDWE